MLLSLRELGLYLLIYSKLIAPLTPLDGLFLCHDFFKLIFTGVFPWLLIRWFLLDYNFLYYLPTFFPSIHNIYWPFTSSRVLKGHSSIIYEAHIMCYGRFARRSHSRSEKAEVIFGSLGHCALSGPKVHSLPISITLPHLFIVQENNWDPYMSPSEFLVS